MAAHAPIAPSAGIESLDDLAALADYSLLRALDCDPEATADGVDHLPREVFSGHYVPVRPTPIADPQYVAHSHTLFRELGFHDSLARSSAFTRMFSGDLSALPAPLRETGWACGYALSIYGTEYTQQCPFRTGNGYGDGRAIAVLEAVLGGQRWEMQLKGAGPTPYCRGGDGRAVLRSSVREFLAQEHMHALGIPTSRSLSLFVSTTETVNRPWYAPDSTAFEPDRLVAEPVAISTRVAHSFIRIGQLELFSRRARNCAHPRAAEELRKLVSHAIEREYAHLLAPDVGEEERLLAFARTFRDRFTALVADWIRVGYCQGNFNSDNCAIGGFTLDYGPFGFCDRFDPYFQPWTGGGEHFAFLAQPAAAERNFQTFCTTLRPLLEASPAHAAALDDIADGFAEAMREQLRAMWCAKLGLAAFDAELFQALMQLMIETPLDYTIFFRELSNLPDSIEPLKKSFYRDLPVRGQRQQAPDAATLDHRWSEWLETWRGQLALEASSSSGAATARSREELSARMKRVNPKYTLREWLLAPAYERAATGDYSLLRELQTVMTRPYDEQSREVEEAYYRLKPLQYFHRGGVSHYSCSS